jgi:hypothetical protein
MSGGLLAIVTLMYLGVALDQITKGQPWVAIIWVGYAIANLGFIGSMK